MIIADQELVGRVWTVADIPQKFERCVLTNCFIFAPNRTVTFEDCELNRSSFQYVDFICVNKVEIDNCVLNDVTLKSDFEDTNLILSSVDLIECRFRLDYTEDATNYEYSR